MSSTKTPNMPSPPIVTKMISVCSFNLSENKNKNSNGAYLWELLWCAEELIPFTEYNRTPAQSNLSTSCRWIPLSFGKVLFDLHIDQWIWWLFCFRTLDLRWRVSRASSLQNCSDPPREGRSKNFHHSWFHHLFASSSCCCCLRHLN